MSRAFTKEQDDVYAEPLIDLHVAGEPVPVTLAGRTMLEEQLARAESPTERRRLGKLLADLVVVEPPADRTIVAFGATVDVRAEAIGRRRFTIVGADEANVASGSVSAISPLGTALLGGRAGDVVTWHRPVGDVALTIEAIRYDSAPRAEE